jgi:PAS domain S-box-containing protein
MPLILVVDDNEQSIYMLRALLHGHGYGVQSAKNGVEALQAATRELPDLVISDILMPVMDGFSLCREWKRNETFRHVPFVFYTATYTDPKDEQLALSLGAERFIVKPLEPDRFMAIIVGVLEEHRRGELRVRETKPPAETQYLREYNAVLVGKLEDKLVQLEQNNRLLADKEVLNQAVLNAMTARIAVVGPQGRILSLNQAWARCSGVADGQFLLWRLQVGDELLTESADPEMQRLQAVLREVLEDRHEEGELEMRHGSPEDTRWFLTRIERVGHAGVGAVIACVDITDRKKVEEALRDASRRKDNFLALLGHELRNPLAPIRLATTILSRRDLETSRAERARAVIERQVAHLARIVDDLLDLSRVAGGRLHVEKVPTDWKKLIQSTAEDWRSGFDGRGIELRVELPSQEVWVTGDPTRLIQVAGNLLGNALKFTSEKGRVVVHLEADEHSRWGTLAVRDTGVGMTDETLARIFEPFEQAPQSLARTRGGVGLGLALVKGLVELHGGEVRASSPGLELGAEIVVRLPLTSAPVQRAPSPAEEPAECPRVLVIEDNRDAADSLQELLRDAGCSVRVAYDGPSGLSSARSWGPEVVVCDIGLPGMDGYEVARAIRSDPAVRSARLIALTGYGQEEDQRRAMEAGFDLYVRKPTEPQVLLNLVAGQGKGG